MKEPYTMACVNVIVADSDPEAEYLATSFYQLARAWLIPKGPQALAGTC